MPEQIARYLEQYYGFFDASLKEVLATRGVLKTYQPGDSLLRPGQYIQSTMLVARGRVKLYRTGEDGNEFFIYYLEPGNACALSMICASRDKQSEMLASAMEETDVILIPITLMDELMRNHRAWYQFVMETYRNRFEELLLVVDSIAFKNMDERLEFYLKKQAQLLKTHELHLTHQQIADDLNSSREVISRLLKKMEKEKRVLLNRNSIELVV